MNRTVTKVRNLLPVLAWTAVLLGQPSGLRAYTLIRESAGSAPLRWPSTSLPIPLRLNDQIGPTLPKVAAGSDPVAAIERALAHYPAASGVTFQQGSTAIESAGQDGANIISFADTMANRRAFELAGGNGVVGLTLFFFMNTNITEADLLFNPALEFSTTLTDDAALATAGQFDIEAVATHELGHVIGLHHSGVESATMWSLTSVLQRTLDADDIAGARTLYPAGSGRGSIAGTVTVNGTAAFGAQVVAADAVGAVAASALTLPNGSYAIEQLPPGNYQVYVEPLDGPHSAVPNVPCIRLGNLSGAGIYNNAMLTTNFPTRFIDSVDVGSDQVASLDFTLPSGAPSVNPVQIGTAVVGQGGLLTASVGGTPLGVNAGDQVILVVAGAHVDQVTVADIDIGSDIALDQQSFRQVVFTCNAAPLPAFVVRISVAADAKSGGRSIVLSSGGERVALTGALRVHGQEPPPPTPSPSTSPTATPTPSATVTSPPSPTLGPCVGDCDRSGAVSVDELVHGVNIALGTALLASCPTFETDRSDDVTVDELAQAVSAALLGCHATAQSARPAR